MAEQTEQRNGTPENQSVIHAAFIQRCIDIAHRYGSNLALCDHEVFHELPEHEHSSNIIIGRRYSTRMPHLAFANRWLYTAYNERGADLIQRTYRYRGAVPTGEVRVEHLSMGQPTDTDITYELGGHSLIYARAAIDNEQRPTPSVLSFMEQVGIPVVELGWDNPPPHHDNEWNSQGPVSAVQVLAIMRVINSQFQKIKGKATSA